MASSIELPITLYGLRIDLVQEGDAAGIVALRSDTTLTAYMVQLDSNLEKQRRWIQDYKKREAEGIDLYFKFTKDEQLVGFSRLSHIDHQRGVCTASSWIKNPKVKGLGAEMFLASRDLAFYQLGVKKIKSSIHRDNKSSLRHWEEFDCEKRINENDYYELVLNKEVYFSGRDAYINKNIKKNV